MLHSLRRTLTLVLALTFASALAVPVAVAEPVAQPGGTVTMEYLGYSFFRFTSPTGKIIVTNPWLQYPGSTLTMADIPRADLILVPNGHVDEVGDAIAIAQQTGARIVAPAELNFWFMEAGVPQSQIANPFFSPGDRLDWEGITIRMVNSVHGSGINAPPGPTATATNSGLAAGYFITFENGWTVYFAGSSAATMDMAMWAEMYQPHAAILPLNGGREPMDFAMMARFVSMNNPNLTDLFPHHHFPVFFPGQRPTVADAQAALDAAGVRLTVHDPAIRQSWQFPR